MDGRVLEMLLSRSTLYALQPTDRVNVDTVGETNHSTVENGLVLSNSALVARYLVFVLLHS